MRPLTDDQDLIRGVAIFGIVATQIMNLSSLPSILQILEAKSTLLYPTFPFSISIVASTTSIIYSILSNQIIVGISSIMTVAQCAVYLGIHVWYSKTRLQILREFFVLAFIVAFSIAIGPTVRCLMVKDCLDFVTPWFGLVMAIVSCARYGAQSSTLLRVIKTRNAASISPYMTGGALFGSLAWTVYSVLAGDAYYLASGLAGVLSCVAQILVLTRYPRIFDSPSPADPPKQGTIHHEQPTLLEPTFLSPVSSPRPNRLGAE